MSYTPSSGYTPAPTIISNAVGTASINQVRRPLDISDDILQYNPNASPFYVLANKAGKESSKDPEFKCLEAQMQPVFDRINLGAGYSAVATSIVVDHGNYFKINDLVLNTRTHEIFLINAAPTGNTLGTIVRGYGSEAAAAMLDNDELRRIGNAFEEGAAADTPKSIQVEAIQNYCEIFKTSLRLTGTEMSTTLYGGKDLPFRQLNAGIEHSMKIESAFLFGQRREYLTTSATNPATSHPRRLTGGILYFISSNVVSVGGALTEAVFNNTILRPIFTSDKNFRKKRTLFVSPLVGGVLNQMANGKIQLVPSDQTFGITVNRYQTFFGDVNIILHPLLEGDFFGGSMIAVDLNSIGYKYLEGRDTSLEEDIVKDGTDARTDQFLSECGLKVRLEATHGFAYGITG